MRGVAQQPSPGASRHPLPQAGEGTNSDKITAAAETLFKAEQKAVAVWRDASPDEAVDAVMYEDVLAMLDVAIRENPDNFHAHAIAAQILLIKADQGDGTYDICTLLDARDDAEYVTKRASAAASSDLDSARATLKAIRRIPPSAIPDPPSVCGDEDHESTQASAQSR